MKLLYGTGNTAKMDTMRRILTGMNIDLIGLKDLGIAMPRVDETGNDPLENARLKALAYYEAARMPVFSCDSGLFIEGLPQGEQPGVHVRGVQGRALSDDEMIAHYAAIARRLGGRATARYINAICLVMEGGEVHELMGPEISGERFWIADRPHARRTPGYPIDSLSLEIRSGKYYYDTAREVTSAMDEGFRLFFGRALGMAQPPERNRA